MSSRRRDRIGGGITNEHQVWLLESKISNSSRIIIDRHSQPQAAYRLAPLVSEVLAPHSSTLACQRGLAQRVHSLGRMQ